MIGFKRRGDTACVDIRLFDEIFKADVLGSEASGQFVNQGEDRNIPAWNVFGIKDQVKIDQPLRLFRMLEILHPVHDLFFPVHRYNVPVNFLHGKSRDGGKLFRRVYSGLAPSQLLVLLVDGIEFLLAHPGFLLFELFFQSTFSFFKKAGFRNQRNQSDMRIVDEVFLNHLLERPVFDVFLDFIKDTFIGKSRERVILIKPGFHQLKTDQ